MKSISACIDICSSVHSLAELAKIFGLEYGPNSHDKGVAIGGGKVWNQSILRIESDIDQKYPIKKHLDELLAKFTEAKIAYAVHGIAGISIYLNFAIRFSTASSTVEFDESDLSRIAKANLKLEISSYPTNES
jgi:hypothetical protein